MRSILVMRPLTRCSRRRSWRGASSNAPTSSTPPPPPPPRVVLNGPGVALEALGPVVVHTDGSISRIENWSEMTDAEQAATRRIIGKRNEERRAALNVDAPSTANEQQPLGLRELPRFEMEKLEGWTHAVHQLAASDCEPLGLHELLALANDEERSQWESLSLGYPASTRGDTALLGLLASGLYADANLDPHRHLLGVAPAEGILLAMHALLEPGDTAIVTTPAYASLRTVAQHALGCEIKPWPVVWKGSSGRPYFSIDYLRRLLEEQRPSARNIGIAKKTVVVVNFPHNPTGFLPSLTEWNALIELCDEHNAYLFSDEMYRHLECRNDGGAGTSSTSASATRTLPSAVESYARGVTLSGLSKAYGLAGLRIGWLASRDETFIERCSELKDYTSICAAAPSECLAMIALRNREQLWARSNGLIERNALKFDAFASEFSDVLEWTMPEAGPVALPKLKLKQGRGAAAHCAAALREEGVMLIAEGEFGELSEGGVVPDARVRIGLGREGFSAMLNAWGRVLERER